MTTLENQNCILSISKCNKALENQDYLKIYDSCEALVHGGEEPPSCPSGGIQYL